jgi:glycosyltransferase involved in cell wall biosynthesis
MRVLLSVASFSPNYGGPALTVSRLGAALASHGAEVALWAPDGSAVSAEPAAAAEAMVAEQRNIGEGRLVRLAGAIGGALSTFPSPNVLHDNGLWLPHNHKLARMAKRLGVARVVSPRGMLEPWAFNYKPIKKRIAWDLYQRNDLAQAAAFHATSQDEAENLARFGFTAPTAIAPNGVDLPSALMRRQDRHMRTILFLSRIHPIKGLPLLIEAFAKLKPSGWRVVIAGPDELDHSEQLRALCVARGVSNSFAFIGPQYGNAKRDLFAEADLFVLPTHSENFGVAVAEALAHEIPVITTTGAPWRALVERACGWWVAPTVEAIEAALSEAVALNADQRAAMGSRGRALVAETLCWDAIGARLMSIYEKVATNCRPLQITSHYM